MLETVKLTKTYRPKRGVPVKALDAVSLRFPDKGMVFLLGKSGSGKSTLLNVLGGLDRYDDGEIRIKGVSSKSFSQKHFDSYRNTYVGFIFQEYNVLEEFSVGANVALALHLQGKKADEETVNRILHEVDLDGYGNRRPNELSGGQKQRVAIARALVKSPDIIMADEPTGALDSATGRQVLETLKRLSSEKLVIVVSHDREFAERYADRIIELADGRVIRDVTRDSESLPEKEELTFDNDVITVPPAYHLTEEDRQAINDYLDQLQKGAKIQVKKSSLFRFRDTDPSKVEQAGGTFHLIRSKLPLKYAFPMGASGLKHKKIRLVFTILLSCIAFTLFALSDTFGAFDYITASTRSIIDTAVPYATLEKGVVRDNYTSYGRFFTEEERGRISEEVGLNLNGTWVPNASSTSFSDQLAPIEEENYRYDQLNITAFSGFAEVTQEWIDQMGYTLIGSLPTEPAAQIAVSKLVYDTVAYYGLRDVETGETVKIASPQALIGKTLTVGERGYVVTGVVDTGFDRERYQKYAEIDYEKASTADIVLAYAMMMELENAKTYSPVGFAMVAPGSIDLLAAAEGVMHPITLGSLSFNASDNGEETFWLGVNSITSFEEAKDLTIHWLDGKEHTSLGKKEIVITFDPQSNYFYGLDLSGTSVETVLSKVVLTRGSYVYDGDSPYTEESGYRIVGYIDPTETVDPSLQRGDAIIADPSVFEGMIRPADEKYSLLVGAMPKRESAVRDLVTYTTETYGNYQYRLSNPVTFELNTVNEVISVLAKVFLYIGIGFAVFAALLLANFIGVSISYKKQEIGILRAIGSRGNDVFRIFFSESFLIAVINFALSAIFSALIVARINTSLRASTGLLLTILNFGVRQVLLLLLISLAIAAVASFLPVRKIAAKRPIDAIRDR